jgi:hypothetical protein
VIRVLLAVCLLAGCASTQWTYTRAGVTPAALDHDLETCRREAHRPHWFALTRSARLDRDALNRCMERKGYTVRRDE